MTVLEDARRVLAEGPVCDACLGRRFAALSHGLSNEERGRALRVTIAMTDDEPAEGTAPADCWVCEGHTAEHDAWAERIVDTLDGVHFETYQVGTRVPALLDENDALLRDSAGIEGGDDESFKSAFNREVGKRVGERTGTEVDFERPDVLAVINLERGDVDVQVNPAFVYGRYRKLERNVPQTEWPCRECGGSGRQFGPDGDEPCEHCDGNGYMYEHSVESYVAPHVVEAMAGDEGVFHGAGREDVDALMLDTGRPFVVEVKHPRERTPDAAALEAEINEAAAGAVEVEGLRLATHEMVERVKELDARKTYRAAVEFDAPVSADALQDAVADLDGARIAQRTPTRVAHRRAAKTRERTVYDIGATLDDDRHATVDVTGEGGLYIKELVHGDDGRTEPSLAGLLGVGAEVAALDVLAVEGEEEPFADDEFFRQG